VKVLFLNPVAEIGGAERVLLDVLHGLRTADPAMELCLLTGADGPLLDRARTLGVQAESLPLPAAAVRLGDNKAPGTRVRPWSLAWTALRVAPAGWRYLRRLRGAVERLAPDLVHSNGLKMHLLAGLAGLRSPVVWHVHDFYGARPLAARLIRWLRPRVAAAVAISEAVAADVRPLLPRSLVRVIHNAVDVQHFAPGQGDAGRLDTLAGLPPAVPSVVRVGLVATYAHWKGHEVFLEAAARLMDRQETSRFRFYVIGGPIYRTSDSQVSEQSLRELASWKGLAERVGFIGFQRDPADCYRALDIVVHASTRPEPFGLTIVEAMACGKPVVISRAGGAAELFTEGHDALGITPGDSADMARAIEQLAGDAVLRQTLGANARRTVLERFDRERLGPQVLGMYQPLVNPGPAVRETVPLSATSSGSR
jgi:glycosyltransferase involved in cell wall biosynthesis